MRARILSPRLSVALRQLVRTVDARLSEFHEQQDPENALLVHTEASLWGLVDALPLDRSDEELLPLIDRFIDAKAEETRLAVNRQYARRLSTLEALRGMVEPRLSQVALLDGDWARHLGHLDATLTHASDTLADPSAPPIDARSVTRDGAAR